MEDRAKHAAPFDEQAALEELERVRQEIERYKQQRKALGEEFEQFTRSFKNQGERGTPAEPFEPRVKLPEVRHAEPIAQPVSSVAWQPPELPKPGSRFVEPVPEPPPIRSAGPSPEPLPTSVRPPEPAPSATTTQDHVPEPAPRLRELDESLPPVPPAPASLPPDVFVAEHADQHDVPPEVAAQLPVIPAGVTPARPQSARRGRALAAGLMLLVIGGLAAWTLWPNTPEPTSAGNPPYAPAPAPPPEAEPPAAAAAAPAAPQTVITTTGPVWVRVVADGETVLERELPADSSVPISAQKTIVIRAGDAGAVRLTIAGQDQGLLGGAGQVVTRRFTVPAPVAR